MQIPMNNLKKCLILIVFSVIQIQAGNMYSEIERENETTATGRHNLEGVRNPDLYQGPPPTLEQMKAQTARVRDEYDRGRIGYDDTLAPGWDSPVPMPELGDFGASKSDEILFNPKGKEDVINQREAKQQKQNKGFIVMFIVLAILVLTLIICLRQEVIFEEVKND